MDDRLVGVGAIYAINPCTEETARAAIDKNENRKIQLVSLAERIRLPEPEEDEEGEYEPEESDVA